MKWTRTESRAQAGPITAPGVQCRSPSGSPRPSNTPREGWRSLRKDLRLEQRIVILNCIFIVTVLTVSATMELFNRRRSRLVLVQVVSCCA